MWYLVKSDGPERRLQIETRHYNSLGALGTTRSNEIFPVALYDCMSPWRKYLAASKRFNIIDLTFSVFSVTNQVFVQRHYIKK